MTTSLPPLQDGRAAAYLVLGAIMLGAGILTGQIEPTAVAAGFIVASLFGLRRFGRLDMVIEARIESDRIIEGDQIRVAVDIAGLDPSMAVDIGVVRSAPEIDFVPVSTEATADSSGLAYVLRPGPGDETRGIEAQLVFDAPMWGHHRLGDLVVRVRDEAGLIHWENVVRDLGSVKVLPRANRLDQLLPPPASHATAGSHRAPSAHGDGSEFRDIREYQPGDRLRDLNWRASARTGHPHINRRIPERGGDVVIVLDTNADRYTSSNEVGSEVLRLSAQAVWALVRNHLAAGDRVGLAIVGSSRVGWIAPGGGSRAKFAIIETLLATDSSDSHSYLRAGSSRLRHEIPASALVVAVSTLARTQTISELTALSSHGRATAMVAINNIGIAASASDIDAQIIRIAELQFEAKVGRVRQMGLPVIVWRPELDLDRVLARLEGMARRRSGGRR